MIKVEALSWDPTGGRYDALIVALGYERRASHIASLVGDSSNRRFAYGFTYQQELSYESNREFFLSKDFTVSEPNDEEFRNDVRAVIRDLASEGAPLSICVDVSSFPRHRLASIIVELHMISERAQVCVDFLYCLAAFSEKPVEQVPNQHVGPVLPEFAGWTSDSDLPAVGIVGVGYEEDKALGAVEHLQSTPVWVFRPSSSILEYWQALNDANATLLSEVPEHRVLTYEVGHPFDCFVKLESLVGNTVRSRSCVLLPFGPKIFALCCMLVGRVHPAAAVWRVSPGRTEPAVDREPTNLISGLRVVFG